MSRESAHMEHEKKIAELRELLDHHRRVVHDLRQQGGKLRSYLDATRGNIVVVDREFNITEVNLPFLRSFNLRDRESVIGHKCYRIMKGLEEPCPCCCVPEAYRTGEVVSRRTTREEKRFIGDRILEICAIPIRDETGTIVNVLEFAVDITDQVRQEENRSSRPTGEVRRSRLRLEKLVAAISSNLINSPSGELDAGIDLALQTLGTFFDVDRSYLFQLRDGGRIMDNTHEWCAEGIEPQKEFLQDLSLDDSPWWREMLHQAEYIHIPRVADLPAEAAVEKEILLAQQIRSLITVPIRQGGSLLGFLGFDSVRGQRSWSEESIALLQIVGELIAAALERRRSAEERKSLEEQLFNAQKMEAIGTLAGGIAHDFNNLLMLIRGHASLMMLEPGLDEEQRERLRGIQEAVRRGAELTGQLLGFARGGKYEVRPADLNAIVEKSSRMFACTGRGIRIHRRYEPRIHPVEVDRGQIEQVLLNMYVNAWQAMPEGGDLYLETCNVELDRDAAAPLGLEAGLFVRTSVTDTGMGMDETVRKRVFEPFFTTRPTGQGSGLGLAAAYGIIANHGGAIDVQSRPGQGAAFHIYLPASTARAREEDETVPDCIVQGTGTILLIDDEEMILDIGETVLQLAGYRVLRAGSGKEGLEMFRQHGKGIDLVILDLIMPDLHGGAVFDGIREMNPRARILLSSGYSIDGHAAEILERGADGFIQKPFGTAELSARIHQILGRK